MEIIERDYNGTRLVPIDALLLEEGKIYIKGSITDATVNEFSQQIIYLRAKHPTLPITLYINSPGGEVEAGLAIRDIIKGLYQAGVDLTICCIQLAASMAALLLAAGIKGKRQILAHSKVMIHEPSLRASYAEAPASATNVQRTAEKILAVKEQLIKMLAEDCEKSLEEISTAISFDNYMNAQEAIAFGLCDTIVYSL